MFNIVLIEVDHGEFLIVNSKPAEMPQFCENEFQPENTPRSTFQRTFYIEIETSISFSSKF